MAGAPKARYIALLRGINVGGKNIIKMTALRSAFERLGFDDVSTYIQSGNVVFTAQGAVSTLGKRIEGALGAEFRYESRLVLLPEARLRTIIGAAPPGFGAEPKKFRYDVIFLMPELPAPRAMKELELREGVDTAHAGRHALYFARLIARASQSRLSRITALPVYKSMTIRNWNTTTALLRMAAGPGP